MPARLFALLLSAALLTGCAVPRPAAERIDLDQRITLPDEPAPAEHSPLRVAVSAMISPKETLVSYRELLDYIGKRVDRPIELVQRATYAEVNEMIRTGEVDMAFVCTWAYVDGRQRFGMELLGAPVANGEPVYYSYLIVPAASPAQELEDLRGGTFAFTDPLSTTGRLVPVYWLWQLNTNPDEFFRKYIYTYSHDRAVLAVADGLVDGAAVDHLVYDAMVARDPSLAARMRVIRRSEPIGTPPAVAGAQLDPLLKELIRELLLTMHEDPDGRRINQGLGVDAWVPLEFEAYEPIQRMLRAVGRP